MIQPAWLTTLCALLETSVPALPISKITKATKTVTLRSVSETQAIRQEVAQRCDALQIDHAFIADDLKLSDFKLVAMDMDSTFITIECIDEIADLCGLKAEVSAITEATMRGEIKDFSESLQRRVALLKGLNASALQQVYDERLKLSPGAEAMLRAVQKAGLKTLLVSGGFTFFTERLQERCGLDFAHANTLEIVAGKLTGKVIGDIVDAQEKAHAVQRVCDWLDVPTTQAIVIGDGANDLKMMALAGMSIAYHAKPVVRAQTSQAIHHGGLDVLLDWLPE
jgi:phosphoserine phosphatase